MSPITLAVKKLQIEKVAKKIASTGKKPEKKRHIVYAHAVAWTVFLVLIPSLLIELSCWTESKIGMNSCSQYSPVGIPFIIFGLFLIFWTAYTQDKIGNGTPVQTIPTQKLIINGPYKYVRNPMAAGIIFYYFGIAFFLDHPAMVLIFTPIYVIIALFNLKFIEEKELEHRFGEEYKEYKNHVPMILPVRKTGKS
ncbi:MAG: isoprenylcysteine carboxylmethyltransferase family protein [Candidatus Altiarchaeota archaeon]